MPQQSNIREHLETAIGLAIQGVTGEPTTVRQSLSKSVVPAEDASIWQQSFSIVSGPALWIVAPSETWHDLANMVLVSAGIEDSSEEDLRSTWAEVVQQTAGAFASRVTADVGREVTTQSGAEIPTLPKSAEWHGFTIQIDTREWHFDAAWSAEFAGVYNPQKFAETLEQTQKRSTGVSKTFDLLLDVSLPVSVSFGKTSLQLREVLKLNTGSIVELDRFVSEPVDVIVNDCVIARGEVVVVDGNYGVRIRQLASREERLRSGIAESGSTARKN